jgi:hypothetical protein
MRLRNVRLMRWANRQNLSIVLFAAFIALPVVFVIRAQREQLAASAVLEEQLRAEGPFDRFRFRAASLVSRDGNNQKRFSAKAGTIIHRNRTTRFFSYANLKELYISDLQMEFYPRTQAAEGRAGLLSSSFTEISDLSRSLVGVPSTFSEDALENLGPTMELLTRVVIEQLVVTLNPQEGVQVIFSADRELINVRGVTFQGSFSLTASDGTCLTAPQAIWLKNAEKIYVPDGYVLQTKGIDTTGTAAAFILESDGKLTKSSEQFPAGISSADWLDGMEERFTHLIFAEIIQHLPTLGSLFPPPLAALQED